MRSADDFQLLVYCRLLAQFSVTQEQRFHDFFFRAGSHFECLSITACSHDSEELLLHLLMFGWYTDGGRNSALLLAASHLLTLPLHPLPLAIMRCWQASSEADVSHPVWQKRGEAITGNARRVSGRRI